MLTIKFRETFCLVSGRLQALVERIFYLVSSSNCGLDTLGFISSTFTRLCYLFTFFFGKMNFWSFFLDAVEMGWNRGKRCSVASLRFSIIHLLVRLQLRLIFLICNSNKSTGAKLLFTRLFICLIRAERFDLALFHGIIYRRLFCNCHTACSFNLYW